MRLMGGDFFRLIKRFNAPAVINVRISLGFYFLRQGLAKAGHLFRSERHPQEFPPSALKVLWGVGVTPGVHIELGTPFDFHNGLDGLHFQVHGSNHHFGGTCGIFLAAQKVTALVLGRPTWKR